MAPATLSLTSDTLVQSLVSLDYSIHFPPGITASSTFHTLSRSHRPFILNLYSLPYCQLHPITTSPLHHIPLHKNHPTTPTTPTNTSTIPNIPNPFPLVAAPLEFSGVVLSVAPTPPLFSPALSSPFSPP